MSSGSCGPAELCLLLWEYWNFLENNDFEKFVEDRALAFQRNTILGLGVVVSV